MAKHRRRGGSHKRPRRSAAVPAGLALVALALVSTQVPALWAGERLPPQPSQAVPHADGERPISNEGTGRRPERQSVPPLPYSEPVRLTIPRIDVDAAIDPVGVEEDGTAEVPSADEPALTGWYRHGASPGEEGSAVILGHVTTPEPAVFFELGALMPGDLVEVTRSDGIVVEFEIDAVRAVRRDAFPIEDVYGPLDYAGLRLVTCGGPYDADAHEYRDNVIAYASLVSWRTGPQSS